MYTEMQDQEIVTFAERYEENPNEVFDEMIETLLEMKENGDDPVAAAKLAWLCRKHRPDHFTANWTSNTEGVNELADWLVEPVFDNELEEEFSVEIDV